MGKGNGDLARDLAHEVIGYAVTGIKSRGIRELEAANPSGIQPTEFKVLVRPVDAEAEALKPFSALKQSGFTLSDDAKEREKFATQEGILIAVSPAAFNYDGMVKEQAPKPGDRVLYAKYAGFTRKGSDGVDYRIVADKDVCAVLV